MAVCSIALAGPASAHASWTGPIEITATPSNVFGPDIAVDRRGDATFAWHAGQRLEGTVEARVRYAGGRIGPTRHLWSGTMDGGPLLAGNAAGDAVVVWTDCTNYTDSCGGKRVWARTLSANGTRGPLLAISPAGEYATIPRVGIDRSGDATFIWGAADDRNGANQRIEIRSLSGDGKLGRVRTISVSRPGWGVARGGLLAVNAAGEAVFLWTAYAPDSSATRYLIQVRSLSAAGALGSVRTVAASRPEEVLSAGWAVLDRDGNATVTWTRLDMDYPVAYEARSLSQSGAIGPVINVTQNSWGGPAPASNPRGKIVFAWATSGGRVQARSLSPGGVLGDIRRISPPGWAEGNPEGVVLDADGNALLTWIARKEAHTGKWVAQWRRLSEHGDLGPVKSFTHPANVLAANPRGAAVGAWSSHVRGIGRIRAVFGSVAASR